MVTFLSGIFVHKKILLKDTDSLVISGCCTGPVDKLVKSFLNKLLIEKSQNDVKKSNAILHEKTAVIEELRRSSLKSFKGNSCLLTANEHSGANSREMIRAYRNIHGGRCTSIR